jgi:RNA polymerase sigma-70 factor (ECF subfamily)
MTGGTGPATPDPALLDAAAAGDEHAFRQLVEPHRSELHAHCYRMLGSLHDADDAVQETMLRAWRGLPNFAGPRRLRAWLYKIATNVCLNVIARRPRRRLPTDRGSPARPDDEPGEPITESVWIEPYPTEEIGVDDGYAVPEARYEQREAVELAFIAALQHLPATQRAVLILRDVLGFSAYEAAGTLKTTTAAVTSALQRARNTIDERLPDRSQQSTLRALGDAQVRELVTRYTEAWERGDVAAITAMLADDATFAMPPFALWWRGRDVIAAFAAEPVHRYLPTRANGQAANAAYRWNPDEQRYVAEALEVLTVDGTHVKEMTAFMTPEIFPRFALPEWLPERDTRLLRGRARSRPEGGRRGRTSPAIAMCACSTSAPSRYPPIVRT